MKYHETSLFAKKLEGKNKQGCKTVYVGQVKTITRWHRNCM